MYPPSVTGPVFLYGTQPVTLSSRRLSSPPPLRLGVVGSGSSGLILRGERFPLIDWTTHIELAAIVGGPAPLTIVNDLVLAGVRSEAMRAEDLSLACWCDVADFDRALVS